MFKRRLMTVLVSALAIVMLSATSAFAFHCYNTSHSETGNAQDAANSQALASLESLLNQLPVLVSLCPAASEEADALVAAVDASDLDPDQVVIHTKTIMASGAHGAGVLHDGRGIDHLPPDVLAAIHALFEEVASECPGL